MSETFDENTIDKNLAFGRSIGARLRTPEVAQPSFEKRLMEKVLSEGSELYPVHAQSDGSQSGGSRSSGSWWRTRREFRLSPLAALALAAGVSAIIAVSGIAVGTRITARANVPQLTAATPPANTMQLVRFVFVDPRAATVELVGDFNEWQKGSVKLRRSAVPGVWSVSVPLPAGRHEYAFIINGSRWVADPLGVRAKDDFGTESSVIRVGASGRGSTS